MGRGGRQAEARGGSDAALAVEGKLASIAKLRGDADHLRGLDRVVARTDEAALEMEQKQRK